MVANVGQVKAAAVRSGNGRSRHRWAWGRQEGRHDYIVGSTHAEVWSGGGAYLPHIGLFQKQTRDDLKCERSCCSVLYDTHSIERIGYYVG